MPFLLDDDWVEGGGGKLIVLIIISEEIKTYLELIFKAMEVFTKTFPAKQFKKAYLIISFPFVCVLVCEMVFFFFFALSSPKMFNAKIDWLVSFHKPCFPSSIITGTFFFQSC